MQNFLKINDKLKNILSFNFNLDQSIQNFFQGISNKISNIKKVIQEEREKQKEIKIKVMVKEKLEIKKRLKFEDIGLKENILLQELFPLLHL